MNDKFGGTQNGLGRKSESAVKILERQNFLSELSFIRTPLLLQDLTLVQSVPCPSVST